MPSSSQTPTPRVRPRARPDAHMERAPQAQAHSCVIRPARTALSLLERLLDFDPTTRITVDKALEHEYLELYHDKDDEPTHTVMNFDFEKIESIEEMKKIILEEITTYPHPSQQGSLQRKGCVCARAVKVGAIARANAGMARGGRERSGH